MSAGVHATGNFAELLWPGISSIWGQSYKEWPALYEQFMEMDKSDKAFEKDQQVTGFPAAGIKEEGNETPFTKMFQGLQKEYRHFTYGIGAVVTREMVEDDQYNVIQRIPRLLSRSMREVEETVGTNVLNNSFSTTVLGADGQSLCSTSHTLVGTGGTASNRPATDADLTQTSFEQGTTDVMDFVDDQGLKSYFKVKKIVVPTALYHTVHKLLKTQQVVGSADNDKNMLSSMGIQPVVTPYLTDSDAWFLITDCPNGLKFYTRREAQLDRDNDFETDNLKIKTTKRFSVGFTDWRAAYGSTGA